MSNDENNNDNDSKSNRGGARDGAGRKTVDGEKRKHRYFLTDTEKVMIDDWREKNSD